MTKSLEQLGTENGLGILIRSLVLALYYIEELRQIPVFTESAHRPIQSTGCNVRLSCVCPLC